MLKNDLKRNRVITATLFAFIMMAAMLISSAVCIILALFGSIDELLDKSNAAHYAQLHAGTIEQKELDSFFNKHSELIKAQQTVELLGINGANIFIDNRDISEADSVMENSFVRQNKQFDYLLDTDNQIIKISDGEIAIPIYHMQKYNLKIGDNLRVANGDINKEFKIVAFLRDSLMNPSMINSKRFLVSDKDWDILHNQIGKIEYMIEFQLYDTARLNELETLYQDSELPQKGTAMGYTLVKVINGMSDGISATIIIMVALMLVLIAALCLRFTLLTTIEEDYREIGVMKAIGISNRNIRKLYMIKYMAMSVIACTLGYLLSLFIGKYFTTNITLYMGTAKLSMWTLLLPVIGSVFVFGAILFFCMIILRRFKHITTLEALRSGTISDKSRRLSKVSLAHSPIGDVNIFLGIKEVFNRFSVYGLLCFVFVICSFLMIVPLNFLDTLQSPKFVTYMGSGQCDLRVDLQQTDDIRDRYEQTREHLSNDSDIQKYSTLCTGSFKAQNTNGEYDNLKIEIGDFSTFPLEYSHGTAPQSENEIALSAMSAEEYHKDIGDTMIIIIENEKRNLTVCGIYQDVTNGGKTAKAIIPFDINEIIWFTANIDLKAGVSLEEKQQEYSEVFHPAKVTDVDEYIYQTLGGIIEQLRLVVKFSFALAISISALITAMFFKMLITKETRQIAIMKSLGFTVTNISRQYITRAILILTTGILLGVFAAGLLGEKIAALLISGISDMQFVVNPLTAYFLCPLALVVAVSVTIIISSRTIRNVNTMMAAE